jgi:MSHA biogenesis protein MshE
MGGNIMVRPEKIRLGDLLIQQKLLTEDQLQYALDEQKRNGRKLGRVLADNGFVTEEKISETLARQLSIPYVNLKNYNLDFKTARLLPENQARRFRALVLEERKGSLLVGMADPTDTLAFEELGETLKSALEAAVLTEGQLLETIDRVYRRSEEIGGLARALPEDLGRTRVEFGALAGTAGVEDAPVVKLLQTLFSDAIRSKASAIHFEPLEGRLQVRFRIDGVLHLQAEVEHKYVSALAMRLKQMSGMDVSEKRLPQEGYFNMNVRGQVVDARISTLPTQHGESMAIRLVNEGGSFMALDKLGMQPDTLRRFRAIIRGGNGGTILVAGNAGSGKTGTLYAAVEEINTAERKIITVEDRVEYRLPGATQAQVNERLGLSFARMLHSALHQDPDVILVGELRDPETSQIALRAAMNGRLVFSATHARDAADALFRLADMGMPGYLVASAVRAVVAQRLLRRVCEKCSEAHVPSTPEAAWLNHVGVLPERWGALRRGRGCTFCKGSGYNGRFGVYEMLEMERGLAEAVAHGDTARVRRAAQAQLRGRALLDHALTQLGLGSTTVEEVMRADSQMEE